MYYSRKNASRATYQSANSENNLTNRLREMMFKRRLSARELALSAGLGQSFVYDILNGRSKNPTSHKMSKIAQVLDVDISYLMEGKRRLENDDIAVIEYIDQPENSLIFDRKFISEVKGLQPENLNIFEISDDKMSPNFNFGEKVIIDKSRPEPVDGKAYLFYKDANYFVRRLILIDDKFYLKPDNTGIIGETVLLSEVDIIGKIVLHSRAL